MLQYLSRTRLRKKSGCHMRCIYTSLSFSFIHHKRCRSVVVVKTIFIKLLGLCLLCRHYFENSRHQFCENNSEIIGWLQA